MGAPIDLDLNDVALFVRVVQAESFTAVARERGVPGSTVSRRIARLESALGLRLLERTTRRLRLTEAGRAYFAHAERAVAEVWQGTDRVRALREEPRGRVRVVAPTALGAAVANVVYTFLAAHPGVSIDLELDNRQVDPLAEGYDVAIATAKADSADLVARELWRSTRKVLYASPRYLDARGAPRRVDDLARHDCIALHAAGGRTTWTLAHGGHTRRITLTPRFYVSELSAARGAALAGVGIAMLPEAVCAEDVAEKRLVRVLDGHEGALGGVYLLYRAHRALTAAVRACVDHFLAELPATDPTRGAPRRRG